MALKPGQIHSIKGQLGKIEDLKKLKLRLSKISYAQGNFNAFGKDKIFGAKLQKQIQEVNKQMKLEIADLKKKIEAAKATPKDNQISPSDLKILNQVAAECSDYLAIYKKAGKVLFRGIDTPESRTVFVGRSWNDRKPKDSSPKAQKDYDEMLKKIGIKALRSNSIFTTSSYGHASSYGTVFVIIPKNTADYSWSQVYRDIVLKSGSYIDTAKLKAFLKTYKAHINKKYIELPGWKREDKVFDLEYAIRDQSDAKAIKMMGKSGFPIPTNFSCKAFLSNASAWEQKYKPTDKNLSMALKKGHEVMISGEYYGFTLEGGGIFVKTLFDRLGIKPSNIKWKNTFDDEYDDDY